MTWGELKALAERSGVTDDMPCTISTLHFLPVDMAIVRIKEDQVDITSGWWRDEKE